MSLYARYVFPFINEWLSVGQRVDKQRRLALADARGQVLELGFGTGLNFKHYPFSVTHVTGIDCERMRPRQVEQRIDSAPVPITTMYRDASHGLLFPDESFDTVVTTWTLCSIHEVIPTLTEIRRVLRPNGSYLFLEHGPSDDPRIARRQALLRPVVELIGAGCQVN